MCEAHLVLQRRAVPARVLVVIQCLAFVVISLAEKWYEVSIDILLGYM